ncbi:UNVERIFIED_CONTAM: hypothetical protein HDU68_003350 [Siphonaria sp. JEL0065]|nr:hypothetical protein HDU68_003350 [Siphonaria sp. JEL0065]
MEYNYPPSYSGGGSSNSGSGSGGGSMGNTGASGSSSSTGVPYLTRMNTNRAAAQAARSIPMRDSSLAVAVDVGHVNLVTTEPPALVPTPTVVHHQGQHHVHAHPQGLVDQGLLLLSSNAPKAYAKFGQALARTPPAKWHARATLLNNMAVAKRRCSEFDAALDYVNQAWTVAVRALADEKERMDVWGGIDRYSFPGIVISVHDLDQDQEWVRYTTAPHEDNEASYTGKGKQVAGWDNPDFQHIPPPEDVDSRKMIHGPPLISLFMDLNTNMGNILFNLGRMEEAITSHSHCLRLAETTFDICPLDSEFRMSFPLSMASRFGNTMVGGIPDFRNPHLQSNSSSGSSNNPLVNDFNYPSPPADRRIHLSYLHYTIIFAQARSLTHLGTCLQALGLDDAALQCNSHSLEIVNFYRKYCVVGGNGGPAGIGSSIYQNNNNGSESPGPKKSATISSLDALETSSIVSSTHDEIRRKKSIYTREDQWENQLVQLEATKVFLTTIVDPLQGTILANLANSFYAKGRLAAAFDHFGQSLSIYKSLNYNIESTNVLSSLHALKIEMARSLKTLHWIRQMESQAVGQHEVGECTRYWGPPRLKGINMDPSVADPDTFADASIGSVWAGPGLKGLKETFEVLKENDDLLGMLYAMVNMASTYLLNGQPYLALHILGSLLTEETSSGLSLNSSEAAKDSGQAKIPEGLRIHVHFTLCQAVFLLLRLQNSPSEELFPRFIFYNDELMVFFASEPINALLPALDLQLDNFLDIDMLSGTFIASIQELEQKQEEVRIDIPYLMLMSSYIGNSGFFGGRDYRSLQRGNTADSHNSAAAVAVAANNDSGIQHAFGVGVGMDIHTQQSFLIRSMNGKNDWVTASTAYKHEGYNHVVHLFTNGIQKLDTSVTDAFDLLRTGTGDFGTESNGFISTLHDSCMVFKNILPLCPESVGPHLPKQPPMRFTSAIQSSPFVVPSLYAVCADVMAYGAYQMQAPHHVGNLSGEVFVADLLRVLKIPQTPTPAKLHKELLEAAFNGYRGVFGMCNECLRKALDDSDCYGELVFVSKTGVVIGAECEGGEVVNGGGGGLSAAAVAAATSARDLTAVAIQATRAKVDVKGRHMFPCKHYYV